MDTTAQVAVIGAGAAGLAAAWRLAGHTAAITVLEAASSPGGNCTALDVRLPGHAPCSIDVGVSDFNAATFTRLVDLLAQLGVAAAPIAQDAAFVDDDGQTRLSSRDGVWTGDAAIVAEIQRFSQTCTQPGAMPPGAGWSLARFCRSHGFDPAFVRTYLGPRARGCFAMPGGDVGAFELPALVAFWRAHGLVGRSTPPPRMAVVGGMSRWCEAMQRALALRGAQVRCDTTVVALERTHRGVVLTTRGPGGITVARFDHVVLAVPPRAAAALVGFDRALQRAVLDVPTQRAEVVVHTDARVMPRDRARWGAYNYVVTDRALAGPSMTFYPKRLRRLADDAPDVFVTLGPDRALDPGRVLARRWFDHPCATAAHAAAAVRLSTMQGRHGLWWCGSHLRAPFLHEHAIESGEAAAQAVLDRLAQREALRSIAASA